MCRESLAGLFLDHHQHARDLGPGLEQVQHNGRGHVVGQVRHHHGLARAQDLVIVGHEGVSVMDGNSMRLDNFSQRVDQVPVDLECLDVRPGLGQGQRERSESGSDLQYLVTGPNVGQARDAPHRIGVDDEVLAQGTRRSQPMGLHQGYEFSARKWSPRNFDTNQSLGEWFKFGELGRVQIHDVIVDVAVAVGDGARDGSTGREVEHGDDRSFG